MTNHMHDSRDVLYWMCVSNIKYNEIYTQGILSVPGNSFFIVLDHNHVICDNE